MSGTNHFQSSIGEDGVERWKYIGPPIELVDVPMVGGPQDQGTYQVLGFRLSDDYVANIRQDNEEHLYKYDCEKHIMKYIGLNDGRSGTYLGFQKVETEKEEDGTRNYQV